MYLFLYNTAPQLSYYRVEWMILISVKEEHEINCYDDEKFSFSM